MTDLTPEEAMEMEWVRYWRERSEQAEGELFAVKAYAAELTDTLARVRAIEEGNVCPHGYEPGEPGCACYMCRVRAAIRGDG